MADCNTVDCCADWRACAAGRAAAGIRPTEYDHGPDCMCGSCSSERLTYCLLTRGSGEHQDHRVPGCPSYNPPNEQASNLLDQVRWWSVPAGYVGSEEGDQTPVLVATHGDLLAALGLIPPSADGAS